MSEKRMGLMLRHLLPAIVFINVAVADVLGVVPREELIGLLRHQEQQIIRLQAIVNELTAERSSIMQQVKLLNTTTASASTVTAATHSALKAEVRRLLNRLHGKPPAASETMPAEDESPWARPQSISLTCKGEAEVDIRPLEADDRVNGECMVLRVAGADLSARFVLYCDARDDNENDSEAGSGEEAPPSAQAGSAG